MLDRVDVGIKTNIISVVGRHGVQSRQIRSVRSIILFLNVSEHTRRRACFFACLTT
jgi:hypothetical protein